MTNHIIHLSDLTSRTDIVERARRCDQELLDFAARVAPGAPLGEIRHRVHHVDAALYLESPDQAEVRVLVDSLPADQWIDIERYFDGDDDDNPTFEVRLFLWTSSDEEGEYGTKGPHGLSYRTLADALAAVR